MAAPTVEQVRPQQQHHDHRSRPRTNLLRGTEAGEAAWLDHCVDVSKMAIIGGSSVGVMSRGRNVLFLVLRPGAVGIAGARFTGTQPSATCGAHCYHPLDGLDWGGATRFWSQGQSRRRPSGWGLRGGRPERRAGVNTGLQGAQPHVYKNPGGISHGQHA